MRRVHVLFVLAVAGFVVTGLALAGLNRNSSIHLNGTFEVPIRDTAAQGQAIFHISKDGDSLEYKLIAAEISNIVQAHIHCGVPGKNGGITVWLYPVDVAPTPPTPAQAPAGGGPFDGILAEGVITNGIVIPQAANADSGCAGIANFDDLITRLQEGGAYVNIHTNDGVAPTNTGPGDFPGGEIRGDTP
jgi:hypothetical protein